MMPTPSTNRIPLKIAATLLTFALMAVCGGAAMAENWTMDLHTLTSLGMSLEAASAQLSSSYPEKAPSIAVTAARMAPDSAPAIAAAAAAAAPSRATDIASSVAAATPDKSVDVAKAVTAVSVGLKNKKSPAGLGNDNAGSSPSG